MNEVYYEETAFPYDYSKQKVYYIVCRVLNALSIICAIVFGFMALIVLPFGDGSWVFPLIIAVWFLLMVIFFMFVKSKFYNCYDFIFVTGDIRIIKVVNTRRRKKVLLFDSKNVYQVGRFESETYEKHKNTPGIKVIYAPSNKYTVDKPKYYIATVVDGVKYLLVLECTEKFLYHVLQFSGKHVLEKEF